METIYKKHNDLFSALTIHVNADKERKRNK